ncbi:MAG: HAD family hydrolase [Bacteroidales bacterium]|nr:HAD family hydrolase [Bacteroidales bacterium]
MYKNTIIWDWNGTLLDDVDICVRVINELLTKRGLPFLSKERYREIFTFPVKDYYKKAGFDFEKEPFNILADEFIITYYKKLLKAELFDDVIEILNYFKTKGFRQIILSAMEHNALIKVLKHFNIYHYFYEVYGIDDHHANGKMGNALRIINKHKLNNEQIFLIGDTLHDFEIGEKLNLQTFLISKGHQSKERLLQKCNNVYDNLFEIKQIYLNNTM